MMTALPFLKSRWQDFARDETGTIAAESVVILPILAWAYISTFVWFDAFKAETQYTRAAYSVADALSREMTPITPQYLNSMHRMLNFMSDSPDPVKMRVTVVCWSDKRQMYRRASSQVRGGGIASHSHWTLHRMRDHLPVLPVGDQVIMVETFTRWEPAFNMGLKPKDITNVIVTRARFAPQVLWDPNHRYTCKG